METCNSVTHITACLNSADFVTLPLMAMTLPPVFSSRRPGRCLVHRNNDCRIKGNDLYQIVIIKVEKKERKKKKKKT